MLDRGLKQPIIIVPEPMCPIMFFLTFIWGLKFRCINIYNSHILFMNFSLCLFSVVIYISTGQFSFYLIRYAESYDSCLITFTGLVGRFSTFYSQYINVFLSYVRFHETSARTFLCFHRISYSETYLVNQGHLHLRLQLD